jgi:hypothetical protein
LQTSLNLLADFTFDVWLIARFAPEITGVSLEGRLWERAVSGLLYRPGFTRRQGPGNHSLFGAVSASGVRHELDGAADGWRGAFIVECKATGGGITKGDAALFHFKVMDFYQRSIVSASREKWWRVMCGAAPTMMNARMAALSLGLLVCDAGRLPLPVLVRAAGRPSADMHLPEPLLQEVVRLGERAMRPHQDLWPYRAAFGEISFKPDHWRDKEIRDLLWLEDELSSHLLDLFAKRRPGVLRRRAESLILQARKVA